MGFEFTMLDIGGGFPGAPDAAITFEEVSRDFFCHGYKLKDVKRCKW